MFRLLNITILAIAIFSCLSTKASAAYITFDNCLSPNVINSSPRRLQFDPLWVDAIFDAKSSAHNLNITLYGNVSGQATQGTYPSPNDPSWNDPTSSFGKIVNVSPSNNVYTTLFTRLDFLSYTPYDAAPSAFCAATVENTTCPIAPAFLANASSPKSLPAFSVSHRLFSSYAFTTLVATITIQSGDADKAILGCISANITPDLGKTLSGVLTYLPAVVLILVAFATVFAATMSPWGTSDPFKWTSNYGRDEDLLRLVTPGFGDCLQYIQFIILAGSLTLSYPGFFQPVVSQVGWSALMFNESFVSNRNGLRSLSDGIYVTNGTYGLETMSQLIGMSTTEDIWADMVVWLLVIIGVVAVACQIGFLVRWALRSLTNKSESDLRHKNWPFTAGNLVRIVCNYFLLPIVALSMFQLVIASKSSAVVTAFAVVLLVAILVFAGWILRLIFYTKPRSHLFDDLQTVLLYGSFYNTYSDDAAPFALIPALLTFIRGVAIGAVQPSGIAQLIMLAICEVILILTLNAFRPFHSPTSMNAYHTFFASVRLVVILLSVAFVPSLSVSEGMKGWIGYIILFLHAIVLVLGFFLNAVQTIIEVSARLAGAGGEEGTGAATRGGLVKVLGMRQLSRRAARPGFRQSMNSDAAMLTEDRDIKAVPFDARSRSLSASSAILLNRRMTGGSRFSGLYDQPSPVDGDQETPAEHTNFDFTTNDMAARLSRPELTLRTSEPMDPYYRAPRPRRATGDMMTPGARSRGSWASGDWASKFFEEQSPDFESRDSTGRPLSFSPNGVTSPIAYRNQREDPEFGPNDPRRSNVDYAVREVDFYYGVRGPALSNLPTRKLKTGPADPVGPVSSAQGWFKGLLGRKTKESGKGFEVVRSSRAPLPHLSEDGELGEVYHDVPLAQVEAVLPGQRTRSTKADRKGAEGSRGNPFDAVSLSSDSGDEGPSGSTIYMRDSVPTLGPIDTGGSIRLPSRMGSRISQISTMPSPRILSRGSAPSIPRKSSRRKSLAEDGPVDTRRLSTVHDSSERPNSLSMAAHSRVPFSDGPSPIELNRRSVGADSTLAFDGESSPTTAGAHERSLSGVTVESYILPYVDHERPTSVGFVNTYRASDSIHPGSYDHGAHPGSSAEVIVEPHSAQNRRRSFSSDVSDL